MNFKAYVSILVAYWHEWENISNLCTFFESFRPGAIFSLSFLHFIICWYLLKYWWNVLFYRSFYSTYLSDSCECEVASVKVRNGEKENFSQLVIYVTLYCLSNSSQSIKWLKWFHGLYTYLWHSLWHSQLRHLWSQEIQRTFSRGNY